MTKKHEIRQAIQDLPDGIPHELWRVLLKQSELTTHNHRPNFNILGALVAVYNDIEHFGTIASTCFSEGWMCPIYKKNDKTDISNYCPITVLNTDYKIFTKTLTNRLTTVAPYLIHPDQASFMKGRKIADQTDLIQLMINKCETDHDNGAIVCLDQEKAYDKIAHPFLWATLRKLNFPNHFINTVKSLYQHACTNVIINGEISSSFLVTRGVRQGNAKSGTKSGRSFPKRRPRMTRIVNILTHK